jgi:predicted enzyme related to lactoylglutathione lyase/uncharacterized protein YndB with AHSA1/START domain
MADILHKIEIAQSTARVYEALTTAAGLASWWTREVRTDGRVGTVSEFTFSSFATMRLEITALEPGKRVEWRPVDQGDWLGTTVSFALTADGPQKTTLRFGHRGWKDASDHFAHVNTRWAFYLESLKAALETGRGRPHPQDGMVPPSGRAVCWFDLAGRDPKRLANFYSELLGWTVRLEGPMGYGMIDTGNPAGIPGGIRPAQDRPAVVLYMDVDDVAGTATRAEKLGARVLMPAQEMPGQPLVWAILADPEGNEFGLVHRRS